MEAQTETEPTARALGKGWGRWAGPSTDDGRLDDLLQRDLLALCAAVTRSSAIETRHGRAPSSSAAASSAAAGDDDDDPGRGGARRRGAGRSGRRRPAEVGRFGARR